MAGPCVVCFVPYCIHLKLLIIHRTSIALISKYLGVPAWYVAPIISERITPMPSWLYSSLPKHQFPSSTYSKRLKETHLLLFPSFDSLLRDSFPFHSFLLAQLTLHPLLPTRLLSFSFLRSSDRRSSRCRTSTRSGFNTSSRRIIMFWSSSGICFKHRCW